MVLIGRIQPHEVQLLNWEAIVRYAPASVLSAELHSRTVTATSMEPTIDPRKWTVAV